MPLPSEKRQYTYEDYLKWPEEERWEIIDGIAYNQATPSPVHQRISMNLSLLLGSYFKGKECAVFAAPFTVRLPLEDGQTDEKKNRNIVEPDLSVVCDKTKLDKSGYSGAPTLIVEIVSKSSAKRDILLKRNKYEQAGVGEYWIITPETESIMQYVLQENSQYSEPDMYILGEDEEINAKVFADLKVRLSEIFESWG